MLLLGQEQLPGKTNNPDDSKMLLPVKMHRDSALETYNSTRCQMRLQPGNKTTHVINAKIT